MQTVVQKIQRGINYFAGYRLLIIALIFTLFTVQSCTTINPGEIGLKVVRGKLSADNYTEGRHHSGFGTHYVKFSTRIKELSIKMTLPTKEGLEAKTDLTILYHVKPESIRNIYLTLGMKYENEIIVNNFAATARETCLNYRAMDLMIQRDSLEKSIFDNMNLDIAHYGFVVDQVLVKDIDVPDEIDKAIEKKVLSEQQAKQQEVDIVNQKRITEAAIEKQREEKEASIVQERMQEDYSIEIKKKELDYALESQKKDAERRIIEAQAAKKVQDLANSTITPLSIKDKSVEVMRDWANSPNAKIIITDGKTPLTLREPQ